MSSSDGVSSLETLPSLVLDLFFNLSRPSSPTRLRNQMHYSLKTVSTKFHFISQHLFPAFPAVDARKRPAADMGTSFLKVSVQKKSDHQISSFRVSNEALLR